MWENIKFWCWWVPAMTAWLIITAPGNWIVDFLEEHTPFWRLGISYQLLDFIACALGIVVWLTIAYSVFRWGFGWVT